MENVRDTVQNSIPVLREELPGSVNPMGDEKTYQIENDTARLLNTLLNPIGVNTYTQSAVSREMETCLLYTSHRKQSVESAVSGLAAAVSG